MFKADSIWEFKISGRVKFGQGAAEELAEEVDYFEGENILVVTDEGIKAAGILDYIKQTLKDYNLFVFDEVEADPGLENFEACLNFANDNEIDLFIGLGGGSSLDVAKAISCIAKYGGDILDYISPPVGGGKEIPGPGFPLIAIPTTSGTGSEVSPAAVVSLHERELKLGISHQLQRPDLALVDPLLTVSMPAKVTASSGIDALTHGIEAFTTKRFQNKEKPKSGNERPIYGGAHIVSDMFAAKSIKLISESLRKAYNNGEDVEARTKMALGSLMAGMSFSNAGLGAVHAMSFPLGGKFDVPHGVANATLLPTVMEFNYKGDMEKFSKIAELMGKNTKGLSAVEAAKKSVDAVKELCNDVNIPKGIGTFGVTKDDIPQMAKDTLEVKRLLAGNPRKTTEEDLKEIFQKAL